MEAITLAVERRNSRTGSIPARKIRAEGRIPAVVYGKRSETVHISIADVDLRSVLKHGPNVLLQLDYPSGQGPKQRQYAVVKEVQRHVLRPLYLNVDLHEVYLDTEIESPVPVEAVGEAEGTRTGGILSQLVYEVNVRALPEQIPTKLQVDVSRLEVGDHIRAAALPTSPDYVVLTDPDEVIVTVLAPRLAVPTEAPGLVPGAAPETEPEMVGTQEERGEEA